MAQQHNISSIEYPMTVGTTVQGPQKRYRRLRFPSFPADVWAEKNPLLQKGELGHEKDTGRFKVGDGVTYWSDLPYNSVGDKGEKGDDATINGLKTANLVGGLNIEITQEGDTITISAMGEASGSYSKEEIDNKVSVINAEIDANSDAIQKTRDDYIAADSEIHQILNSHTRELTTLRGNQASLGDQVSGIEEKIPGTASATNHLITKQQLLDEEMDIRDDLNSGLSELQTQITAQAEEIATKQDKLNAGDNIVISGNTISATGTGGAGFDMQVVDQLPATGKKGVIYLVPKDGAAPDVHDEYVWIESTQTFELIGTTQVDLTDYVKNTDYATSSKAGIVKPNTSYGLEITATGELRCVAASESNIASRAPVVRPITPQNFDYAVKTGVTTNTITLTDEEKAAAQAWLGIESTGGGDYLPLSGGTLTGELSFNNTRQSIRYTVNGITVKVGDKDAFTFKANNVMASELCLAPVYGSITTLGASGSSFANTYTQKLNNGADLIVPTEAGTLARIEDINAIGGDGTAGQVLTKTDDGVVWQDAAGGGDCGLIIRRL